MPSPNFHYEQAERLLEAGVKVVNKISDLADHRKGESSMTYQDLQVVTHQMDELGKKVMGIWAQAQVHATLATVGNCRGDSG